LRVSSVSAAPTKALTEDAYDRQMISRLIDWSLAINASWEGASPTTAPSRSD
jgi:hypothetical protein